MELEKRKWLDDGKPNGKRLKAPEDDDGVVPGDEEVEEFFAILRRIQVALKYFQDRNGGRDLAATVWNPSFEREDFEGVNKDSESSKKNKNQNQNAGLDLNSDPVYDASDSTD